ncbi:MAG: GMC family oxidoreductase N-terminal domain-containing protein [Chloroflexi bacterium]|nr:GMC family oxidoreductase N-terminal domain-containing protein [Chloroflexota bacterium]
MSVYDFIVVGAGAGGAAVANRLSENPKAKVLLLEAGGSEIPENVRIPYLWFTLFGSPVDWGYNSTPQYGLNNRQTYEPRGKIPGGSSNLYIMMHIRGHRSDYDNWAYNGCPGWAYDDVLPYFQRSEDQEDSTNPTAGHGGAISVINAKDHNPNPTSYTFLDACRELGFPATDDFNGLNMEGAGWHHVNIKNGKRHGANEAYIEPIAGRKNFTLSTGSYATRLLFEGSRCVGVEYVQDGQTKTARATGEVVVAGGALESPKLLMLSGIGPAAHLKEVGINVKLDLPGVGQNFHNHVLTGVIREGKQQIVPPNLNISEVALFLKSNPGWVGPDLQMAFLQVPFDIIVGQGHPNSFSILPGVVRPLSRGWIKLASADPADKPLVNPNYLGVAADRERLVQGVKLARDIFATKAFSELVGDELLPGPGIKTDADLHEFVRQHADSYHHQSGSCKMGLDEMAVVDPQLRVFGVEGLRVADASVFPQVPSGNCHSGILMIGEKCADMIKKDHGLS